MKNFKRIVSFVMAMVIFVSFFCYNVGAYNYVFIRYDRSDRMVRANFSNTSAYALARIAKWTDVETTTDFMVTTFAYIDDYEDVENLCNVVAKEGCEDDHCHHERNDSFKVFHFVFPF